MWDNKHIDLLNRFSGRRVLVIGDAMLDRFVYGTIERISPEAPIPVLRIERTSIMPGGAGNVVQNCVALGAKARLIAVIGNDDAGRELSSLFGNVNARLIRDAQRKTTVKVRYVAERQQVFRADSETTVTISPDVEAEVLSAFHACLPDADVVIVSDYAKGLLSPSLNRQVIDASRRVGKPILVDPKSRDFTKYTGATVITPNRAELELVCGHDCAGDEQVVAGARTMLDNGICAAVVVTRGSDGMSVVESNSATHLRTTAHEVFDVSGAGDTVVSVLALGLAAGGSLEISAGLANLAAGLVVRKRGTATVTPGEIMASLRAAQGEEPHKVLSLNRLLEEVGIWRERGETVAFTNGCFDLLHPGHISLLKQAKAAAGRLVVGLNSDSSVRRLKGVNRPVQSESARATVLSSLECIDAVVIFAEDTPLDIIKAMAPDVLVKGADYSIETVVGAKEVIDRGGRVLLADLLDGHSTTRTLQRVAHISDDQS